MPPLDPQVWLWLMVGALGLVGVCAIVIAVGLVMLWHRLKNTGEEDGPGHRDGIG